MDDRFTFRGKSVDNGKWIEGYLIEKWWYGSNSFHILEGIYGSDEIGEKVIESTIGQCTGLRDRNGRLVFEGDICRHGDRIIEVVWYEGSWHYTYGNHGGRLYALHPRNDIEIIGNIHDNPKLLSA